MNSPLYRIDPYGLHWTDYIPDFAVAPGTVNFFAGMGDNLSFGLTNHARDWMDVNYAVNKCAGAYTAGQWTGEALQTGLGGAAGFKAAGKAVKGATEFSHSIKASRFGRGSALDKLLTKTKLNGNYVSRERHYLHDAERFPIKKDLARELWGDKWPAPIQALERLPRFPVGTLVGANAGDLSRRSQTGGCD